MAYRIDTVRLLSFFFLYSNGRPRDDVKRAVGIDFTNAHDYNTMCIRYARYTSDLSNKFVDTGIIRSVAKFIAVSVPAEELLILNY